jgi:nucleoside 2-deoxyribosyltransferase
MQAEIYLAGSLFTASERVWNSWLAAELKTRGFRVWLPQEHVSEAIDQGRIDYEKIFRLCLEGLERSEVVIALLEGADVDSGTAFECGYAFKLGRPILGVRSDFRTGNEADGLNIMLRRCCRAFVAFPALEPQNNLILAILEELRKLASDGTIPS